MGAKESKHAETARTSFPLNKPEARATRNWLQTIQATPSCSQQLHINRPIRQGDMRHARLSKIGAYGHGKAQQRIKKASMTHQFAVEFFCDAFTRVRVHKVADPSRTLPNSPDML